MKILPLFLLDEKIFFRLIKNSDCGLQRQIL